MDPIQTNLKKLEKVHGKARKKYIAKVYPGRLTLFRNGGEDEMPIYQRQWMRLADGGLDCQIIPGNYFTILREPHVRVLAQKLQASLDDYLKSEQKSK